MSEIDRVKELQEQLHYAYGTCDLAIKYRNEAIAEVVRLRERNALLQSELDRANGVHRETAYWIAKMSRRAEVMEKAIEAAMEAYNASIRACLGYGENHWRPTSDQHWAAFRTAIAAYERAMEQQE